jgi:hypothetical protein
MTEAIEPADLLVITIPIVLALTLHSSHWHVRLLLATYAVIIFTMSTARDRA